VFIYVPKKIEYCWVLTEKEIVKNYNIKSSVHNISFSVQINTKEKGVKYRCQPDDLFEAIIKKTK